MKNQLNVRISHLLSTCLIFLYLYVVLFNSINAQNNFCDAVLLENSNSTYCFVSTQIPTSSGESVFVEMSCDIVSDGIQNSSWFRFEVSELSQYNLNTLAAFNLQWSIYKYSGQQCPFEANFLEEFSCSLCSSSTFYYYDPGTYYIQIDGVSNQEGEVCITFCDTEICEQINIFGCTDFIACNFDPEANEDDGSCIYGVLECPDPCNVIFGCTDQAACNFNPVANCGIDECIYNGSIGDLVWEDLNDNGNQDAGENGIAGITITLTGPLGSLSTISDAIGYYLFNGLIPGDYTVSVGPGPPNAVLTTAGSYQISITCNQLVNTADFGFNSKLPFLGVNVTAEKPTVCLGDSTEIEAFPVLGTPPYSYLWNTGAVTKSINVKPSVNTTYMVAVTDSCGLMATGTQKIYTNPFGFISQPTGELIVRASRENIDSILIKLNGEIADSCDCDELFLIKFPDIAGGGTRTILDIEDKKKKAKNSLGPEGDVGVNQNICYWESFTEKDSCSIVNAEDEIVNSIIVGLVDTGVDLPYDFQYTHQEPDCNDGSYVTNLGTVQGIDRIVCNGEALQDNLGHGTHISNIMTINEQDNLEVFVAKFMDKSCQEESTLFNVVCALEKMGEYNLAVTDSEKIRTVNLSLGYYGSLESNFENAINALGETGATLICSAGNESEDLDANSGLLILKDTIRNLANTKDSIIVDSIYLDHFPSEFESEYLLSVTSWDYLNDELSSFSNYGNVSVDLVAPGDRIKSKIPMDIDLYDEKPDGYGIKSGTSMSVPFITRWVANILSEYPNLNTMQIIDTIKNQGSDRTDLSGLITIEKLLPFQLEVDSCSLNTISGYVWNDINTDSLLNDNELGIENILVTLLLSNGSTITTFSNQNGYYEFLNLIDGDYIVSVSETIGNHVLNTENNYNISISNNSSLEYNFGFIETALDCDISDLLTEFPWLENQIDFSNCEGVIINVYYKVAYQFIEIIEPENNRLYFNDGTLWCEDWEGFSCAEFYCSDGTPTTYECCDSSGDGGGELENCNALNLYPWISNFIDVDDCENGFVKVYDFDSHAFVLISDGNLNKIYFNGMLWCTDGPGFDCVTAYGLNSSNISEECVCSQLKIVIGSENEIVSSKTIEKNALELDFKIIPNPNSGIFELFIPTLPEGEHFINIYNVNGKLIESQTLSSKNKSESTSFNLGSLPTGVYYIEMTNSLERVVKRFVKF